MGQTLTPDQRALVGGLFAAATARLEAAHEACVAGQATDPDAVRISGIAENLRAAAEDALCLVDAAVVLSRSSEARGDVS